MLTLPMKELILIACRRFDPKTGRIETLPGRLPKKLAGHSCVVDPNDAETTYCFGGDLHGDASVITFEL